MICTSFQKSVLWNLLQYQYKVILPICKWKITHWHVVGGATCRKKLGVKILSLPLQTCWFNLQTQFKLTHCLLHVHTVIVENNYRLHDIRRNKRYIGTYTKKKRLTSCLIFLSDGWSWCAPPTLTSHSWGSCLIPPTTTSTGGLWA